MPNLKLNYLFRLFYEILAIVISFITAPYVSRVLEAGGVGKYSFSFSIVAYFTMFAALGTNSYGMRAVSICRDDKVTYSKTFWEIELMTIITSLICLCLWIVVIFFSGEYKPYFIALLPAIIATMFDISWFFNGHEKVIYTVSGNALCKIVGVICIFLFVKEKNDLILYIIIQTGCMLLGNFSMWLFLPRLLVKVNVKDLHIVKHLKETLIYFIPTIATTLYTIIDKTLIGIITKDAFENGYYEQATKIIGIAKTVVFGAVNSVMGARIAYLYKSNCMDDIKRKILKSMDFIFLLGFACCFGICGVADRFVPIFFGEGYDAVVSILRIMSPLIIIIGISNCLGCNYYTPAGLRTKSAKYIIVGLIVNLIFNSICIPICGSVGAVLSSILAELVITFLYVKNATEYMTLRKLISIGWNKMFSGIIMLVLMLILGRFLRYSNIFVLALQCFFGMIAYIVVLLLLKDSFIIDLLKRVKNKISKNA